MGVSSSRSTVYVVSCDVCKKEKHLFSNHDDVHTKREALYGAGYHIIKRCIVLCDDCFDKYRNHRSRFTYEWEGIGKLHITTDFMEAILRFEPEIPEIGLDIVDDS